MVTGQCKKSGYTLKHPYRHYLNSTEQTINLFASHLVFHQHSYDRSVFLFSSLLGNPSIVLRIVIKISVTFIQQEVALFSAFVIVFVTVFLSLSLDDGWRQPQVRNQSTELSVSSSQQIVLYVRLISSTHCYYSTLFCLPRIDSPYRYLYDRAKRHASFLSGYLHRHWYRKVSPPRPAFVASWNWQ